MTRDTREVLNIEAHIKALLPESYLESIGANVQAPNHKRELHHRCMRIFDDLASRLESCHAPPDDLVAVSRAQLASIEWALYVDTQRKCPACDALRRNDVHKPECWLAAALAAPVAAPVPEYPCPARHDLTGPLSGHAEALARLDPDKIYVENVRSILGVSMRQAEVICETAVRQGFLLRGVEALCPDGVVGASADRIENLPPTVHCWREVDGHIEESHLATTSLRKLNFYRFHDDPQCRRKPAETPATDLVNNGSTTHDGLTVTHAPAPDAMPAPNWIECPNCGGMGTTFHDILVGGTEHDTEERCCEVCKGTGKRRQEAQS